MPLVIDLFSGEGGAAVGYMRAGFQVVGVDNRAKPLRRYPFPSYEGDWKEGLIYWLGKRGDEVVLVHASPPCQLYSTATRNDNRAKHPDLIAPVREFLVRLGIPYVIENVPLSPLIRPVELCGCMFDMTLTYRGMEFAIYRPRLFESDMPLLEPDHSEHVLPASPVFGEGSPGWFYRKYGFGIPTAVNKEAMGTQWMTQEGMSQSIPPIFTELIGIQARGLLSVPEAA